MSKEDDEKECWWEDLPDEIAEHVYRLEFTLPKKGTIVSKDLRPSLRIDEDMIEDHLRSNPAARYFWSSIHAEVRSKVDKLERLAKARRGFARKDIATELSKTEIKQTDKLLDALVESDIELQKIEEEISDTWNLVNKLSGLIASIDMRHESLRTLAGFKKGERQM